MTQLRIAILGFAHYHANFWAEAITSHPGAVLARIWDDDMLRGIDAAQRYRSVFCSSVSGTIEDIDAVAITSETAGHEVLIKSAAALGKPILCEKPLAANQAQAERIATVLRENPVFFMQSLPKRLDPVNHALRDLITSGELGDIRLARVRHGHAHGLDPAFRAGWWTDPARSGGGTFLDEGVHAADLLRWLFGDPSEVSAMMSASSGLQVEDTAVATFRWAEGMLGEIVTGWTMVAAETSIEVYGKRGTALVSGVDLASRGRQMEPGLSVCLAGSDCFVRRGPVPGFTTGGFHQAVATAFVDALLAGNPPPVTLADGLGAQAMIEAAYKAARTGRTTAVVHDGSSPRLMRLPEVAR
jgi:myo-inositol 2-dehydrogenase / D-chiro-inositol 1-dehydrogenase